MNTNKSRYQWGLAGALLLLLGVVLLVTATNDLRRIKTTAEQDSYTQLRLLHDVLHDELKAVVTSFNEVTFQGSGQIADNSHAALLHRIELLKSALPALRAIVARDAYGEVIGQTVQDNDLINTPVPDRLESERRNNQNGHLYFSKSFDSNRQLVLVVHYPLKNRQGILQGWIQGRLNTEYFGRRLETLRLHEHMNAGLAFEDGTILLLAPEAQEMTGTHLSYLGKPSWQENSPLGHSFYADMPLSDPDQAELRIPLYFVTWADTTQQRAQWQEHAYFYGLTYLLLCLGVIVLIHKLISRQHAHWLRIEQAKSEQQFNDERFKLATESAGIGVWEFNLKTSQTQWDKAMHTIYGTPFSEKPLSPQEWLKFVIPEDITRVAAVFQEAGKSRETLHFNFSIRRISDGKLRHIQARAKTHRDTDGTPFRMIGVNVDVTIQRQSEDALREAEERFRSSFEWAAIGMAMLDFQGRFIQVNRALTEILGYSSDELLTFTFDAVTHPQDTSRHVQLVRDVLRGNRHNYQLEKRYIHKSGHVVWVHLSVSAVRDDAGRVIYFISQVQDISERKRNEATLIEREHFLRTLSECLPGLVSYWSTDLRCHFANRNHEKWTGIPAEKMRGQHMRKVLGEDLFQHDHNYVAGVLRGEKQRFERRKPLPTGGHADLLVHLIPDVLYGKVEGFFSLSTNITDFKAQQRELEMTNLALVERTQQAEAASKAKGAFLANMSHEIRTPMNAIIGLLQLLEDTDLQARQRDFLNKIGSAADVLLNVLNDILDISRVEANKLELDNKRFLLDQVLHKATDLFGYRAEEKAIQLYCTKEAECPVSLKGDRLRLAQVLNNLLSNALKFTDKGRIHLQVQKPADGDYLLFSVKDTGIGMNTQQCANLFKPFSQVDESSSRRYGGAGLGLSISKNLVELMGGKLWVESEPGAGSTFHFTIACIEPDYTIQPADTALLKLRADTTTTPTVDDAQLLHGKKILVVDDHKLNRVVASEMLKKWGARVELAEDGKQAVQACISSRFDMVLMDLQMPEMDGYEATAKIIERMGEAAPPIVAVTASATEQDRMDVLNAGMCEHIIKPFKKDTLIEILMEIQSRQPSRSS